MAFGEEGLLGYIKALSTVSVIPEENKKHGLAVSSLVVIITLSGFLFTTILVMIILWLRKRRSNRMTFGRLNSSSTADPEMASIPGLPVRFSYEELVAATENFNNQIGSGGFGTVYKGTIADKTVVAVKKMKSLGVRGKMEFCNETASIGNIHHVNLVKLRGLCIHGKQMAKEIRNSAWNGTGSGLLAQWMPQKIIHCDIKPENILLHSDFQVKISDFGLAKLLSHENSKLLTTLSGTRGYLAPEWLTSHGITDKTDVYSYGMVLLELVRGSRNFLFQCSSTESDVSEANGPSFTSTSCNLGMVYFPLLALEMHKQRRYMELADPRLEGQVRIEEVETLVRVALSCLHIVPTLRPSMTNVVAMLEGRLPIREPRVEALEFLRLYGGKITETSRLLTRIV
uniref:G-type lectin S-receptor-like serine/threonine-protein kinase At5g35370 n=1 Tax=Fragaria vesca subsp. vesca TaxID=101020 RepID=UPI0005CAF3E9|nr:PREDICTED: G-type lectin S-receptor-like serine/threonine-protein kinase At5g35370 [Fragaria vesca subsp. vesca]